MLEAAKHETDSSNYKTVWDRCKTRFGKVRDGIYEESVRFGNFESNDEAFYATTLRISGSYQDLDEPTDFMSQKLRPCT